MINLLSFDDFLLEGKKPGPKEYYSGLSRSTATKRAAQIKKQTPMDDDDPDAYKKLPGDSKKTKPSKYTKKFAEMFNEEKSTLKDQVESFPDGYIFGTHITDDETAKKIFDTNFKFNLGTSLSGTVGLANKKIIADLLDKLSNGISPHRGQLGLFILAFPESEFGKPSPTKKVNLDTIENDMLDKYEEFMGGVIPKKFNFGYFSHGVLHTREDQMNEGESGPIRNQAIETALRNKLEKIKEKNPEKYKKVTIGILRAVMRRGMGAWKTGHRPGAGEEQWGYGRVNSFLTGGKTIGTTANPGPDGDLGKRAGLI